MTLLVIFRTPTDSQRLYLTEKDSDHKMYKGMTGVWFIRIFPDFKIFCVQNFSQFAARFCVFELNFMLFFRIFDCFQDFSWIANHTPGKTGDCRVTLRPMFCTYRKSKPVGSSGVWVRGFNILKRWFNPHPLLRWQNINLGLLKKQCSFYVVLWSKV